MWVCENGRKLQRASFCPNREWKIIEKSLRLNEVCLLLCLRSQDLASEMKSKTKNTEFSLVVCTRSCARYSFGTIQKYSNNNITWLLTILSSSSPFNLLSSTSSTFQFSFQSGKFKTKLINNKTKHMYIKMYCSAFDKVPHTANYADVCPRDVVLAFEWVDQILWKVVQMELEFTNCSH